MSRLKYAASSILHTLSRGRQSGSLSVIENALLYTLTKDHVLHYNVVCRASVAPKAFVQGCDVTDLSSLRDIMGVPDAPEQIYTTQTGSRTLGKAVMADLTMDDKERVVSIRVKRVLERPTVGISWKKTELDELYPQFAETLERNGAYAVYLPCVSSQEEADAVLDHIDGILMTGGGDFAPIFFEKRQTPHGSQRWNRIRDRSDLHMIRRTVERDIPLLGICRGAQGLNIAMGGTLIQDIPLYLGQKVRNGEIDPSRVSRVLSGQLSEDTEEIPDFGYMWHDRKLRKFTPTYDKETGSYMKNCGCGQGHFRVWVDNLSHSKDLNGPGYHTLYQGENNERFVIDPDSKWLHNIIGGDTMEFITSTHHQAVDPEGLGEGITIAARASDGIVEAIEYKKNLFALGVQWHPERDALHFFHGFPVDQQLCNAPLRALVDYSRIFKQKNA